MNLLKKIFKNYINGLMFGILAFEIKGFKHHSYLYSWTSLLIDLYNILNFTWGGYVGLMFHVNNMNKIK